MWRKIGNIIGGLLAIVAITAYICCASYFAQQHRNEQKVEQLVISVDDDLSGTFTSSEYISKQLQRANVKIEGELIDNVDIATVSKIIAGNGFVKDVNVYVTYSGEAHILVEQHKPVLRFMCGGLNSYVTREGVIFCSPQGGAYYAPVVTGSYKPVFPPKYEGRISDFYAKLQAKEDSLLLELKGEFSSLKSERGKCVANRNKWKKQSRRKKLFENKEEYERRKASLQADVKRCEDKLLVFAQQKAQLEKRQMVIEERKKKLQKSYDDFVNLINFVSQVEEHSFWSAEVVQFVADKNSLGEISLRLMPRSGDFVIEFGTLADGDAKLEKLEKFYDDGLVHIGWESFKIIDVRYDKQVICTK